ncbi:hypothetical protein [Niastella sp. OAS944]|nr:hypothetical protein [Chitinophagaceae bacterium OAS944]
MRSTLSNWYNQFWMPVKHYTNFIIRCIRNNDHDNNPFIIF